jgi:hypothetical protein
MELLIYAWARLRKLVEVPLIKLLDIRHCGDILEYSFFFCCTFASMKVNFLSVVLLMFVGLWRQNEVLGQDRWEVVSRKAGIVVSAKHVPESKIKAVRVTCTLPASTSQIVALLLDVDASVRWVSDTKSASLVRKVSPSEIYYYTEISLPWPLENRDFVARVRVSQNSHTKVVTIDAPAIPGWVDEKKGVVRINHSIGYWTLTRVDARTTHVQYQLQVDPGGIIPAWLVNALSAHGPMDSFTKMKTQLQLPKYKDAQLPFIEN